MFKALPPLACMQVANPHGEIQAKKYAQSVRTGILSKELWSASEWTSMLVFLGSVFFAVLFVVSLVLRLLGY
jgi:hypothetical protein